MAGWLEVLPTQLRSGRWSQGPASACLAPASLAQESYKPRIPSGPWSGSAPNSLVRSRACFLAKGPVQAWASRGHPTARPTLALHGEESLFPLKSCWAPKPSWGTDLTSPTQILWNSSASMCHAPRPGGLSNVLPTGRRLPGLGTSSSKGQVGCGQELWWVWEDPKGMADNRRHPGTLALSLHRRQGTWPDNRMFSWLRLRSRE